MKDILLANKADTEGRYEFCKRFADQITSKLHNDIFEGKYPDYLQLKVQGRTYDIEFSDQIWARYIADEVKIMQDIDPSDPREWNEGSVMISSHPNLGLSLESGFRDTLEELERLRDYDSSESKEVLFMLPLYLYDHSGITISTKSFSCSWDSGQVGFIYITEENARTIWGLNPKDEDFKERVIANLEGEVKTYDQYITGDVYGFRITDPEGEEVESCWGFYGQDWGTNGVKDYIPKELWSQLDDIEVSYG